MAHQIEENDTMISVRETPWHKLGTVLPDYLPIGESLKRAGLDFTVLEGEVRIGDHLVQADNYDGYRHVRDNFNHGRTFRELKALYRAHPKANDPFLRAVLPLGIVGKKYGVVQPSEMRELLETLLAEADGSVQVETAGTLRNSRVAWIQAKLGAGTIVNDDPHVPYLLIANSWDGSQAFRVLTGFTRVVCANTLAWAQSGATTSFTMRHSASITSRVAAAQNTLKLAHVATESFQREVEQLLAQPFTDAEFSRLVERIVPIPDDAPKLMQTLRENKRDRIHSVWSAQNGPVANIKNTAYGAVMAVSDVELWAEKMTTKKIERQALSVLKDTQPMLALARKLVRA